MSKLELNALRVNPGRQPTTIHFDVTAELNAITVQRKILVNAWRPPTYLYRLTLRDGATTNKQKGETFSWAHRYLGPVWINDLIFFFAFFSKTIFGISVQHNMYSIWYSNWENASYSIGFVHSMKNLHWVYICYSAFFFHWTERSLLFKRSLLFNGSLLFNCVCLFSHGLLLSRRILFNGSLLFNESLPFNRSFLSIEAFYSM